MNFWQALIKGLKFFEEKENKKKTKNSS